MKISAGILAWNEEGSIGPMIESLCGQSLLARVDGRGTELEIIVVPNGCTDSTAERAESALAELCSAYPHVKASVRALSTPGKANAWNQFVHHLSDPSSDYLLFLDADIQLHGADTLLSLIRSLEENPHAKISTDRPIKHIELKPRSGLLGRLLVAAGSMTRAAPGQLTGQLYCARAEDLRKIVIPAGLIVEDGFIKQMICTDGYRQPADQSLIVRAPDAAHVFECYTRAADVFNHQVRQAVGQTIYSYLREDLMRGDKPVFDELRRRSEADPDWLSALVRSEVNRRGWWVMDTASLSMRWRRVRFARGAGKKCLFALVALAALAVDIPVFWTANYKLRSGKIRGIWKDTSNREMAGKS